MKNRNFDIHGNTDQNGNSCIAHATHVAGIIGAYRQTAPIGVEGVAPGAVIWSMKVINYCGEGSPGLVYMSSVLTAINAIDGQTGIAKVTGVAQQRLRAVANISILWDVRQKLYNSTAANPFYISETLRDELRSTMKTAVDNGIFFSVAGGNDSRNACELYPAAVGNNRESDVPVGTDGKNSTPYWKAKNAVQGVMAVGAINYQAQPMLFAVGTSGEKRASYGECVKIWAPGQSVQSTVAQVTLLYPDAGTVSGGWGGAAGPGALGQHFYGEMTGSSMAAPHVAGAALLLAQRYQQAGVPLPYPWEIEEILKGTANKTFGSAWTGNYAPTPNTRSNPVLDVGNLAVFQ